MSVLAVLAVVVALLVTVVVLALAGGLGYIAYRRPVLLEPITLALVALGVFTAIIVGVAQVVRA
ncbi:hypothetical protein [Streptomyces sp. NPDC005017]|uniref:hypothetical protein n=1 Tax=Streptomyces sp. NPDC005017 TaxID=3364706 RepID=UPI0036CAE3DD